MACGITDPLACVGDAIGGAVGDAIENMARAVIEATATAIESLGTLWVTIGTPNLTSTGGGSSIAAGTTAPNSDGIIQVLGWVTWIAIIFAAISIILLGALIATRIRNGEGFQAAGRLGIVLGAIFLISGATALVSGLLPNGPQGAGGAVLFLQSSLWWYMGAAAVVSVIIGGVRMAWEQRAEPGKETVKSLLTLIVVAGAGVTTVALLVSAFDSFSVWILNGALNCDAGADTACFRDNIQTLLQWGMLSTGGLGALLTIILGLIAILVTAGQILLMVARGGMLVILTGILPLSAAATNTEMGKSWFKKNVGWLVAFILYKPAAAIVYAAAFQLAGTNVFQDDGTGFIAVLTGLILMVLALFALPALMRFVIPVVGAMSAGAGGALGVAALAALPTGAAAMGRLATGSGGGSSAGSGSTGSPGSTGSTGPSGANGGGQSAPQAAQASSGAGATTGAAKSAGAAGGGTGTAAASAGGGAAAGGAAAGAGGGAAAGAASGAAAGPWGAAAGAALGAAKQAGQAATGAARNVGEQATGEGSGS